MIQRFTFVSFMLRVAFALALVLLTFNPSGFSFVHLVREHFPNVTPVEAVAGLLLAIGWVVFLHATLRSIGMIGMLLALALCAALLWLIASWGWISLANTGVMTWVGLIVLALVLAIGMSWSHLYQRWSGQAAVDDVENG